jgi:hypothetical protein
MRTLLLPFSLTLVVVAGATPALAQVSDIERAAARDLFKQGDELQHQGQLAQALDKFQRAQQVFPAPTNLLRIAECEAGLGKLVEATETYRSILHTPLPAGSPPAFQTAVEQANNELPQVEPLVPKVTIQVTPAQAPGQALQIDGQTVPAALLGAPIPLDPGTHTIVVSAQGFAGAEQKVVVKEREAKTVPMALRALPPSAPQPPVVGAPIAPPAPPASTVNPPGAYPPPPNGYVAPPSGYVAPPTPPPSEQRAPAPPQPPEKKSTFGLIAGLHFGDEVPAGNTPLPANATSSSANLGDVSGSGLAYALDGGLRFARNWILGVMAEHAQLDKQPHASNTTMVGATIGVVTNPDRLSFYGALGVAGRWYSLDYVDSLTGRQSQTYQSADVLLSLGLWIPVGSAVRLLPEILVSIGSFSQNTSSSSVGGITTTTSTGAQGHEFYMLGVAGYYNLDL